jgi:hypothetical protein
MLRMGSCCFICLSADSRFDVNGETKCAAHNRRSCRHAIFLSIYLHSHIFAKKEE